MNPLTASPNTEASRADADDPLLLRANAWCGAEVVGALNDAASLEWGERPEPRSRATRDDRAPLALDLSQWSDPRVGWGLVVPDRDDCPPADKAIGLDLCEPLQTLLRRRAPAPVLRWRADLPEGRLRRYAPDGSAADLNLRGARGTGALAVPYYLLIAAGPTQIPWRAQYRLQTEAFVGRLDLERNALARYVDALLSDWPRARVRRSRPLVWATDHGHPDITRLMRKTLAEQLAREFADDREHEFEMDGGVLIEHEATGARLIQALIERDPAFVMTSSHGSTSPLDNTAAMRATLGLPVDQARQRLALGELARWDAYGSIWYAHACCSAGADGASNFADIVAARSTLRDTLDAIARVGATQAPLPSALLGGARPARAFVGHVEPTFDWTLRDPITGQRNTESLIDAFYGGLHRTGSWPIGLALHAHFHAISGLLLDHAEALQQIAASVTGARERARRTKLIALDRLALVLLGDPTVRLGDSG